VLAVLCSGCYLTQRQERVGAFAEVLDDIESDYIAKVDVTELYQAAMKGMVNSLGDKYSAYLSPSEYGLVLDEMRGEFTGVGISIARTGRLPLVMDVQPDGPADRAGVKRGDVIARVDGEDVAGMPLDKVASIIRGAAGTQVVLALRRPSTGAMLEVKLVRRTMVLPAVSWRMLEGGIGLLTIPSFDRHAARGVKGALAELQKQELKGLILDLRGDPGGLLDQAAEVCDMFLDEGVIISMRGEHVASDSVLEATPGLALSPSVPMVVLVDEETASAAEITSGALQALGRASVVGTGTVGKGSVTDVHPLADGSGLMLTVARYELAGGKPVEGVGIRPDVVTGEVPPYPGDQGPEAIQAWLEAQDRAKAQQLEAAVKLLKEKAAAP
jgi:carboxyl-terminal processing protease